MTSRDKNELICNQIDAADLIEASNEAYAKKIAGRIEEIDAIIEELEIVKTRIEAGMTEGREADDAIRTARIGARQALIETSPPDLKEDLTEQLNEML